MILTYLLSVLTFSKVLDAAFTSTPVSVSGCVDGSATFNWVYDNPGDVSTVSWDFGLTNVFNYQPSSGNTVQGGAPFRGRVTHEGNGSITIDSLTASDAGSYTCTVTYNSNPIATNDATLVVNSAFTDSISTSVSGSTASVNLGSQNGVDVEWKNTAGTVVGTGTTFTGKGTFTVCLTGCVSGSATACKQVELESGLGPGPIAGIVISIVIVVVIVAVVAVVVLKKCPCQKGSNNKKPDSGNSGSRSVTPNQVSPSIITTDKKIERPSKVDEKNTKPLSPVTLALTNEAKPGGRALPPIPQHEKKKKTPRKKKKRVKTEDGEDTEKLPPIQKKERNIEHYTRDTQDPES